MSIWYDSCNCSKCVWAVVLDDGWIYCSWNGFWVGENDLCSQCWRRVDFHEFVKN